MMLTLTRTLALAGAAGTAATGTTGAAATQIEQMTETACRQQSPAKHSTVPSRWDHCFDWNLVIFRFVLIILIIYL